MPRAHTISDVVLKDEGASEAYREKAAASITAFGGSYVVRGGGSIEVLEGDWQPSVIVMAEFPDIETAKQWYRSLEYAGRLNFAMLRFEESGSRRRCRRRAHTI